MGRILAGIKNVDLKIQIAIRRKRVDEIIPEVFDFNLKIVDPNESWITALDGK